MPNNLTITQPFESNRNDEANQQLVILGRLPNRRLLKEIIRDIRKQVLETKYTLNLGQLLEMTLDIKHYILNSILSKPALPKSTVASIVIYHKMVIIQVQVGKNFIEDVHLDGGFGINIITEKLNI